jgi:hypothetical protein
MNQTKLIWPVLFGMMISGQFLWAQSNPQISKLDRAAPENCLVYSSWRASQTLDPNDKNASLRLLAEPSVQRFVSDLTKRAGLVLPATAETSETIGLESDERHQRLKAIGSELAKAAFQKEGCFFVEDIEFDVRKGPKEIGLFFGMDVGKNAISIAENIAELFAENGVTKRPIEKTVFYEVALAEELNTQLYVGAQEGVLMIGMGEKTMQGVLRRMSAPAGKTPQWLSNIVSHSDRIRGLSFINTKLINRKISSAGGFNARGIIEAIGFGNVESIESVSGFSENESYSRILIRTDGRPEGIFDIAFEKGIQSEDISLFPKDSLFAGGISIEPRRAYKYLRTLSLMMGSRVDPLSEMEMAMEREIGVNFEQDIVNQFGNCWTIHNGAGDGWFGGLTMTATVKDQEKIQNAIDSLIKISLIQKERSRNGAVFTKRKSGDAEIYSFSLTGESMPFQPSWTIHDNRIILGLFPQAVETAISASKHQPDLLIDQPQYEFLTQSFADESNRNELIGMIYVDAARHFEISYPYVQVALAMTRGNLSRDLGLPAGPGEAIAAIASGIRLPPARDIHKHLKPSYLAIRRTDLGIEFDARQTIPGIDTGAIAPMAFGLLLPALQQARGGARRVVSQNNMRQITLAGHNYHSAHQYFPAGYSIDDNKQPLLSWRVYLLPFIEQNDLYEKFKLDEPWDSPNNKPLAKLMPEIYRSPNSKAKDGLTVYRGVGGNTGMLGPTRGKSGIRGVDFGRITDGSSNTMFLIETSDQLAVPWSKPDEGLNPENFDMEKIFGMYSGGTNVSIGDGSVQFLPDSVDKRTLKMLMEMNDGNVIPDLFERTSRVRSSRLSYQARRERQAKADAKYGIDDNSAVVLSVDNMLNEADKVLLAKEQKRNALKQIALALHNFESAHRTFPSAYSLDNDGKPLLSWRVHILPFLDEMQLYEQFKLDEPWDSEHNIKLVSKLPKCYQFSDGAAKSGKTTAMANGGSTGVIIPPSKNISGRRAATGIGFGMITDGSSNTILLLEAPDELAVEWTKPTDFAPDDAMLEKILAREFTVALSDGSTHLCPKDFSIQKFKLLLSRADGNIVRDWFGR